ncbi:hypothetical protein [Pontibacter rugosus]|uniref:Uncharacterized protein n=1 Tax=Pontibacter rugosus TaxID=1745966 RepID=A0ABW3SMQ5_9BACT
MATYKLFLGIATILAGSPAPLWAQASATVATPPPDSQQTTGAASAEALATLLHQALQNTNFKPLLVYLADKQVYDGLLQASTTPVREAIMLYTPDQIQLDFQRGFNDVIRTGAVLEVNWAQTNVQAVTTAAASDSAAIVPVQLHLSTPGSPGFVVQFSAALLNGYYYYLPPLFIPSKDLD